ncbi:MAG: AMP-binding protein [Gammaproteobacteria bacterium]|jgi:phenylacetate-CoA ligase|nr:AMP-binding protein [Gammaproteobacteria bacterium]
MGASKKARKKATAPFHFQPEIETLPRKKLARLQLKRLKKTLAHAYANVAHFRTQFDAAGVKPGDLKSLEDLAKFPFSVKDDLRATYPFDMFAVPMDKVVRVHASSGTTGKPTVVGYTRGDIDRWADLMARSIGCAGGRPGDIMHNAYGYGLFTGGLGAHYGGERLGCTVTPMSGGNTEKQIVLLQDFGARVLCATPSYALNIAEVAEAEGVDIAGGPLAIGVFGAEPWSEAMRAELDQRLGIRAVDIYGLSEIMGPGVAAECVEERAGLHGWEDHFLFEIIDPESGEPQPMGESGELVITTLTKRALPMIRYRTRDITRLSTEPCTCGRSHVRILRVTGRNDDMLIIRGVNVYPSQIEAVMVGFAGIAPHYQLVVRREGSMDTLAAEIEAAPETASGDYEKLAGEIRHHIKSLIGVTCDVLLKAPGEVPRSQGKAVRVRDERPKG